MVRTNPARKRKGQSIVEMAMILPLMLMLFFGIIDLGYFIYAYTTVYQAARTAAEKAASLPPFPNKLSPTLNRSDLCVTQIISTTQEKATLFPDITDHVTIRYLNKADGTAWRAPGQPVEVQIKYGIRPLTPLWGMFLDSSGVYTITATARRSIESLAEAPSSISPNQVSCKP